MRMLVIVGLAGLASCATKLGEPFTAPDGKQAYAVSCNGSLWSAGSIATCQTRAREICKGDYVEINRTILPGDKRTIEIVCG